MSELNQIEPADDSSLHNSPPPGGERSRIGSSTALRRTSNPLKIIVPAFFVLVFASAGYWFYQKNRSDHLAALGSKISEISASKAAPGSTAGQPTSTSRRILGVDSDGSSGASTGIHSLSEQGANSGSTSKEGAATSATGASGGYPPPLSSQQALKQAAPGQPLTATGGASPSGVDVAAMSMPRSRFDSSLVMQDGLSGGSATGGATNSGRSAASNATTSGGSGTQTAIPAFPDLSKLMMPQTGQGSAATPGAFGNQLTPSKTPKATASLLGNRSLTLAKGASIDCVLDTAFSSDAASQLTCTVTKNVFSDDGKVVLIDKGSKATGESGNTIKQGQTRIFVLWNRIKTPSGVIIELDSPGADALGRGGISGDVDNHFMERFGAAFLVSMFQDAFAYGIAKTGTGNNSTSVIQNTQSTGNSMATEIVRNTISIPPTLQKNQGERISISVVRDLDFSAVYELKAN